MKLSPDDKVRYQGVEHRVVRCSKVARDVVRINRSTKEEDPLEDQSFPVNVKEVEKIPDE